MSKFERIAAFISVVEQNGFAAAARKQGVSTAAISRQVALLESDLKTVLLKRTTRQVSLTEAGAEYYQHAKKAVLALAEAELAMVGNHMEPSGVLSVTSSRYFALHYIIPYLPEFMAMYPNLQIKIELAERFPDLNQEGVDVVFGVSMEGPPELVRRKVSTTRYVLCASPAYLEKNGRPKAPVIDFYTSRMD